MKDRTQRWLLLPLDWLLLFAVVYGAVMSLQSGLSYPLRIPIWPWVLGLTGVFCALFRLKKAWISAAAALVLLVFGCFCFRQILHASVAQMVKVVLERLTNSYLWASSLFPTVSPDATVDVTPAFLLVSAALALFACACVVWLHTVLPCALWCIACVLPSFFVTNTPPDARYLLLMLFALLVLCFSQGARNRAPQEAVRATLCALAPAAIVLGLVLWLFPEEGYRPPLRLEELASQVAQVGENLNSRAESDSEGEQGVQLASLGEKPQRTYIALTVRVDGDPGGYLYLRGRALERFDGTSWQMASAEHDDGRLLGSALQSAQIADVDIHTSTQRAVLYTPGYLVVPAADAVWDYYIPNADGLRDYSFQMYLPGSGGYWANPEPETLSRQARDAAAHCLELPDRTRESLLELARANALTDGFASRAEQVQAVVSYVRACAVYDLAPERLPAGADFCTWFLTQAGSGYCVHFATATVGMLRTLGIPARYVEGYVTALRTDGETPVQERQAHAWVEVFFEGEGWRTVDPTPSDGVSDSAAPGNRQEEPIDESEQTPSDSDAEAEATQRATEPRADETDPAQTQQGEQNAQDTSAPQTLPGWVWLLPSALSLGAGLWLLRVLRKRRRRRIRAAAQGNRLALLDWKRYVQLCRACRQQPEREMEALAKKASFSQHRLTGEELAQLEEAIAMQEQALRVQSLPRRLWYSYWLL